MATVITMPKFNLSMKDGTVKKWFKGEGEAVTEGDILCSVANGKTTGNIEAPCNGVLLKIVVSAGGKAACDAPVAYIGEAGETAADIPEILKAPESLKDQEEKRCVLVIGGGPGGYVAAIRAAQLGARVTLVEKQKMGGTCLNVGCIPTKSLLHSAELYAGMKQAGKAGITADHVTIDWQKVQENKRQVSEQLSQGVEALMDLNGIELIYGTASFLTPEEVRIEKPDGTVINRRPDRCIIASGSVPAIPPIPGVRESKNCTDSTGALSFDRIPETMVVIGGGVIGVELACAYSRLGSKVSVIEMLPKLLPMMDGELTAMAKEELEKMGITFYLETQVRAVEDRGGRTAVLAAGKDGSPLELLADKVLVAVGRRTNTALLNLEQAGIQNDRGRITVNNKMETSVKGIYAIGDCVGKTMLAHTASAMGETAAENAMGKVSVYDQKSSPSCVYISPEFAGVGLTEEQAEEQAGESGLAYEVGRFPMAANGKSLIMGETSGWMKVLVNKKTGKLLGVHMLGARATDLIAEAALAIQMGATIRDIRRTIHAHPTVAEAFREAVLAAEGQAIHNK